MYLAPKLIFLGNWNKAEITEIIRIRNNYRKFSINYVKKKQFLSNFREQKI